MDSLNTEPLSSVTAGFKLKYAEFKAQTQMLYRPKLSAYMANKTIKDFKSMKEYWTHQSKHVPVKSDKSNQFTLSLLLLNEMEISDEDQLADTFNCLFTNFESMSTKTVPECLHYVSRAFVKIGEDSDKYLFNNFKNLKRDNLLNTGSFEFVVIDIDTLRIALNEISTSSAPGISQIPTKILKHAFDCIGPILLHIINTCIKTNVFPIEWKSSIVRPLYKNKWDHRELNNYRGISVLPPVSKLFEKILAMQIRSYFESNSLFSRVSMAFAKGICVSPLCMKSYRKSTKTRINA